MSKAVKTIIGVAAAVAIPFAAPAIAQSAALSGLVGSLGLTGTSALVGAGLGAASSAVTGGNVARGALMGGIGGGIGGYTATPAIAAPAAVAPTAISPQALAAANATADPIAALNASQGWTNVDPAYLASIGGGGVAAAAPGLDTTGLSGAMQPTGELGTGLQMPGTQTPGAGLQMPTGPETAFGTGLRMPTSVAAAPTTTPMTFSQALSKVPEQIASKFTDPKALADMTLRAAGQLAGSALAGSGLSDQEQALLDAQTQELRTLQQTNADLFRQKLEQAQGLIGASRYFDPEYFGLQRARQVQLAGAQAKRKGLRGLEGQQRAAEARRFDLATGRDVGTAYDVGFGTGVQGRLQTMQSGMAGLQGLTYPSTSAERRSIYDVYSGAARRSAEQAKGFGEMYGSLLGIPQAQSKGQKDKDKEPV